MNNGTIKKILVEQNNVPVRAFDDEGAIYRASDLESFIPITFYDLPAGTEHVFILGEEIQKPHHILSITSNSSLSHQDPPKNIIDNKAEFNSQLGYTTYKNGKIVNQRLISLSNGEDHEYNMFLYPGEKFSLRTNHDFESITFWCRPCYIEPEIAPRKLT